MQDSVIRVVRKVLTANSDSLDSLFAASSESPAQAVEHFMRRTFVGTVSELDILVSIAFRALKCSTTLSAIP